MSAVLVWSAVVALASHGCGEATPTRRPVREAGWRDWLGWFGSREADEATTSVRLNRQNIEAVEKAAFANTPLVEIINLNENNIAHIDVGAFEGVPRLKSLSMWFNKISVVPAGLFRSVPALEEVHLSNNRIKEVPLRLFHGLTSLRSIWLNNNSVELISGSSAFANLPSLREVDLSSNRITSLPPDTFSNSLELRQIHLFCNRITDIPKHLFSGLKNLERLTLSDNKIEKLDNSVFDGLNKLKVLHLSENRIRSVQLAMFNGVPNLETLFLSGNGLIISETQGVYPPTDEYLANEHSQEFRIREGLYSPFQNLRRLANLQLSTNNISVMCTDWRSFVYLWYLDLSRNNIPHLSTEDMNHRTDVQVDLTHNSIVSFDPYVYSSNRSVPTFLLSHNPYHCSCAMLPFVQKYLNKSVMSLPILKIDGATCAEPTHLRGKWLGRLTEASVGTCSTTVSGDTSAPELQILPSDSRFDYKPDVWTPLTCKGSNLPNSSQICLMQYKDGEENYWNCYLPLPSVQFFFCPLEDDDNSKVFCIAEHYVNKDYSHAIRLAQSTQVTLHLTST